MSKVLSSNPLPEVIQVYPIKSMRTPEKMQALASNFTGLSGVQDIQVDTAWVQRINAIMMLSHRLGVGLVVLLSLGIVGLLVNQNRITLLKSLNDLRVLHLIGAPKQFIRRPLIYRSALYALIAATVACGFALLCAHWLDMPLNNFMRSYHQDIYNPIGMKFESVGVVVLAVVICSVIATFITSSYHLRQYANKVV